MKCSECRDVKECLMAPGTEDIEHTWICFKRKKTGYEIFKKWWIIAWYLIAVLIGIYRLMSEL